MFAVLLAVVVGFIGYQLLFPSPARRQVFTVSVPQYTFLISRTGSVLYLFPHDDVRLKKRMEEISATMAGELAYVVENLTTGQYVASNEYKQLPSASLYKIPVMIAWMEHAKVQNKTLGPQIVADIERMIEISSNEDGQSLGAALGWDNITKLMRQLGFFKTVLSDPPVTSAYDMAQILAAIYNEGLIDTSSSRSMLSILKRQQIRDRIPKYLPREAVVANKTGEINDLRHDVAIVEAPHSTYILVLLGYNIKDSETMKDQMAKLSESIYDYFTKQFDSKNEIL